MSIGADSRNGRRPMQEDFPMTGNLKKTTTNAGILPKSEKRTMQQQ